MPLPRVHRMSSHPFLPRARTLSPASLHFFCKWALMTCALAVCSAQAESPAPDLARQKALVHLVRQDCGSCHGLTLQGGLGSPLTAQSMADKPIDSMVATILNGRPGTPMPPWRSLLSEAEAVWIVEQLQRGFPKE